MKRVKWERSKRLNFGSLVCLSSDEFSSLVFATVENRDANGLSIGELDVRFENVETVEINQFIQGKEKFVMIESPAYFEAYRHVLEAFKEIKAEEFPFQRHIVECCQDVQPPEYLLEVDKLEEDKNVISFDFTGILVEKTPVRMPDANYHVGSFIHRTEENGHTLNAPKTETKPFYPPVPV